MRQFCLLLALLLICTPIIQAQVLDDLPTTESVSPVVKPTPEQAVQADRAQWRQLLAEGNYAELERIANELRAKRSKYANGRGKDWKFYWIPLKDNHHAMSEEDYRQAFIKVEAWLQATPDSVAARLMLANLYHHYAFLARGGAYAAETADEKLRMFTERSQKARQYLDEIAADPTHVDNVHRRLQIETAKGIGEKPDIQLVYDGLQSDPLNMELVHGMAICLLPRWYGDPGELEEFADEIVRRTERDCGAFQYLTVVMATKEFLKEYVLLEHEFNIDQIRQSLKDALRLYPEASEYRDEAAQLLYLSGDVAGAIEELEQIKDHPSLKQWEYAEISFDVFRNLIGPAMLEGQQKRMIVGSTTPLLIAEPVKGGELLATLDREGGLRIYETATGQATGWAFLPQIKPWTVSFHAQAGLLLAGLHEQNSAAIYNVRSGEMGLLPTFKQVEATCFSSTGERAAVVDAQGVVTVYNLKEKVDPLRFDPDRLRHCVAMAFSPDDRQLALTTRHGKLIIINLDAEGDAQQVSVDVSEQGLRSLAWSNNFIALGGWRGTVYLLDRERREVVKQWSPEQASQVRSLDFSPNGQLLAIGHDSEAPAETPVMPLSVWRVETEGAPRALKGHLAGVPSVRFMENGKTIVSASRDWTIRFWDAE